MSMMKHSKRMLGRASTRKAKAHCARCEKGIYNAMPHVIASSAEKVQFVCGSCFKLFAPRGEINYWKKCRGKGCDERFYTLNKATRFCSKRCSDQR